MPLPQAPTLMLRLTPGTDTTDTGTGHTDMATMDMATDMDTTTERGLLMPSPLMPLLQALTLMLRLTPGTDTTGTGTDLMAMLLWLQTLWLCLLGIKSGPQEQHPTFSCRLISKTPVFAKHFLFSLC